MNKSCNFFVTLFSIILFSFNTSAQNYFADFENFGAGERLACQDSINWTTWSLSPCHPVQDAYITANHAFSGTKSIVIHFDNDVVKPLGNQTSATWYFSFYMMIPSGKEGYFSLLSSFWPDTPEWAMEVYFMDGGSAVVHAGMPEATTFTYPYNAWFLVEIIVNLQANTGEIRVNNNSIYVWTWTLGAYGNGGALRLAAADFWGYINNEMYVDNVRFDDTPLSIGSEETDAMRISLEQNYPNPFNPSTNVRYSIPQLSQVQIKIFDILGNEIETLINEEKSAGSYEVTWYAENLPSGIYFYQLRAGNFTETKKMLLLK